MQVQRLLCWGCLAALLSFGSALRAHEPAVEMAEAARHFLAALSPEQQAKATFEFTVPERENWHFIPRARQGLPLKELAPAQHHLAVALLASGLSHRGLIQASTIMSLEQILQEMEQGKGPVRDPALYYFSIFGKPGPNETWGWRVEGHHLAINFTVVQGREISSTPTFFGTNPAEVRQGPRAGLRVLATEEDLGRALITSFPPDLRSAAIIQTKAPDDIITGAEKRVKPSAPAGVPFRKMNKEQRALLRRLVNEYVTRERADLAAGDLARIEKSGWDNVFFAWAGGLEKGQGHYYRVQGPGFVLEYDNTQNNANHVHSVWRDFGRDFGDDLLRRHYEESHSRP